MVVTYGSSDPRFDPQSAHLRKRQRHLVLYDGPASGAAIVISNPPRAALSDAKKLDAVRLPGAR